VNADALGPYLLPAVVAAFFVWRFASFRLARRRIPALLAEGAVVVDVRSAAEYAAGARPGSLNIPLSELKDRLESLDPRKPVILCCASGTRSAAAVAILKGSGFRRVINAGPWTNTLC
jgi:rhodanese-related sulfurtransferase